MIYINRVAARCILIIEKIVPPNINGRSEHSNQTAPNLGGDPTQTHTKLISILSIHSHLATPSHLNDNI